MKKRVLIISNDTQLVRGLYTGINELDTNAVEIAIEPDGVCAYQQIKANEPDLLITDLETPGLTSSWVSVQLDGVTIGDTMPTMAISRLLNNEEREILTDMTGVRIYSRNASMAHLSQDIFTALAQ